MLEKIFIKNYNDVNNPKVRTAYAVMCSILGIITNLLLSGSKILLGVISGSISIIADGIDNLSDCASSIATLIGFKLASLPPDPEHPFGHERIEYLTGIIISILIIVIGVMLGRSSIEGIINSTSLNIDIFYILVIVLSLSILIKMFQFIFYRRISKKINSSTIKASSQDSLNDCLKTFFVLIAVIIFKVWELNLDSWFGLIMSIYIIINGIKLVKEASSPLIGEKPSKEFTKKIIDKILSYDAVLGIHDLVIHNYGPGKTFVTVHVEVDSKENILETHDMIDNIERDFKDEMDLLMTIHMDPIETSDELTNKLSDCTLKELINIDPVIKYHDFRIVKGNTHINVLFDVVVPQKFKYKDDELVQLINQVLIPQFNRIVDVKINLIINVDKEFI